MTSILLTSGTTLTTTLAYQEMVDLMQGAQKYILEVPTASGIVAVSMTGIVSVTE